MALSEVLTERGLVHQTSAPIEEITDAEKRTFYWGVDPSADSMHVGQLQGALVLRRFLEDGHKLVILIGAGTGMIGDPGGKSSERNLLDDETVNKNAEALRAQFSQLFGGLDFAMVNNADWLRKLNLLEFLRDTGKHFTVNEMIKRDTVRPRLETPDASISFTEFSYSLLQAFDFLHLFENKGVTLQLGGSDQWGNILPGVDLIRRIKGEKAYALSWPLLINKATGKKFGKSEGGAVWLNPQKTSPFQFYQFWLGSEDESVEEYLVKMTMLPMDAIRDVLERHAKAPQERIAQKVLAKEVTTLAHGTDVANVQEQVSGWLFGESEQEAITEAMQEVIIREAPSCTVLLGDSYIDVLVASGLAASKREAREFLENGAIALNGAKVSDMNRVVMKEDFQNAPFALLKRGKRSLSVLTLR